MPGHGFGGFGGFGGGGFRHHGMLGGGCGRRTAPRTVVVAPRVVVGRPGVGMGTGLLLAETAVLSTAMTAGAMASMASASNAPRQETTYIIKESEPSSKANQPQQVIYLNAAPPGSSTTQQTAPQQPPPLPPGYSDPYLYAGVPPPTPASAPPLDAPPPYTLYPPGQQIPVAPADDPLVDLSPAEGGTRQDLITQ